MDRIGKYIFILSSSLATVILIPGLNFTVTEFHDGVSFVMSLIVCGLALAIWAIGYLALRVTRNLQQRPMGMPEASSIERAYQIARARTYENLNEIVSQLTADVTKIRGALMGKMLSASLLAESKKARGDPTPYEIMVEVSAKLRHHVKRGNTEV